MYAGCTNMLVSKLQGQIALSSCEAEYISLTQSMRDTIPTINLLQELKDLGFEDVFGTPKVHCKAFEDNMIALFARVDLAQKWIADSRVLVHHGRER